MTEFILLGFSGQPEMKLFLFALFLGIYLLTLAWNPSLMALVRMASTCTRPCPSSPVTCPSWVSATCPPQPPRRSRTSSQSGKPSPRWAVPCSALSSAGWGWLRASCWRPWHLIAVLRSAARCPTRSSYLTPFV